ncbi:MAG: hypothetical protein PHY92_08595 [Alphaproteobacteria bacterium]|nr:hypothetical protein [Alphaproteobacteria bacterium]
MSTNARSFYLNLKETGLQAVHSFFRPVFVTRDMLSLPLRVPAHRFQEFKEEAATERGGIIGSFVKAGAALVGIAAGGALAYAAATVVGLGALSPLLPIAAAVAGVYAMAWRMGNKAPDFEVIREPVRPGASSRNNNSEMVYTR